MALKLDTRAFEKIAKVQELAFVVKEEKPTAIISTKLGADDDA